MRERVNFTHGQLFFVFAKSSAVDLFFVGKRLRYFRMTMSTNNWPIVSSVIDG